MKHRLDVIDIVFEYCDPRVALNRVIESESSEGRQRSILMIVSQWKAVVIGTYYARFVDWEHTVLCYISLLFRFNIFWNVRVF